MKILLFGKNGQVARRLYPALLPLGEVIVYGSKELDFKDFDKLRSCIKHHRPDVIVNAAAYTQVDKAESEADIAFAVNAEAVKVIAKEARDSDAWLVHYSTDYIFDGNKNGVYTEEDKPNPLGVYGQSKLVADSYINITCEKYIILRTSWVFDSYGKNFPKTILSLAQKNDSLSIVDDQIGAPTSASLIANVTAMILYRIQCLNLHCEECVNNNTSLRASVGGVAISGDTTGIAPSLMRLPCRHKATPPRNDVISQNNLISGIYNLTSAGEISWYGFACALIKEAQNLGIPLKCLPQNITPISTRDYPTPAKRPLNSRLHGTKLRNKFGLVMPEWSLYITPLLEDLKIMGII